MTKNVTIFITVVLIIIIVWCGISSFSLCSITPTCLNTTTPPKQNRVHWKDPLVSIIAIPSRDSPQYHLQNHK
jgi:hypothetical protein